jgi:hypothetical protein
MGCLARPHWQLWPLFPYYYPRKPTKITAYAEAVNRPRRTSPARLGYAAGGQWFSWERVIFVFPLQENNGDCQKY